MTKNHFIIIAIVVVLIISGTIYFKSGVFRTTEEVFSLSGIVSGVDAGNKFLIVRSADRELKVLISESTKLVKLEASFDSESSPEPGTQFIPKQTEVFLGDFKEGDEVFIKSPKNIAGKTNIDIVDFIQILP